MGLQSLDGGKPVAVYSQLGDVRQRSEGVEFRVEAYAGILGERLAALRAGAVVDPVSDPV